MRNRAKNLSRAGLTALALLVCLALVAPSEEELFKNGDFEAGLDNWRTLDMSKTCTFEIDRKVKKSGKKSLRIERGDGERPDFLKQFAELSTDGGSVSFKALVRVDKPGAVHVSLLFSDKADKAIGTHDIDTVSPTRKKWKEVSGMFEVPEGTATVGVNFWFREPGIVWIDDVSLSWEGPKRSAKREKGASFEITNGDFSDELEGWDSFDLEASGVKAEHDRRVGGKRAGSLRLERERRRLFPIGGVEARVSRAKREKVAALSFAALIEKGARASVSLQALGANGSLLATERVELVQDSDQFVESELRLELPRGTEEVAVLVCLGGTGKAWFDDFELGSR